MNKKILIIISVLVVIAILVTGVVFAVNLGIFQDEKDAFFKYAMQNSEILELFQDEELNAYSQKSKNSPYTNEGKITYFGNSSIVSENSLNEDNSTNNDSYDFSIDFNGKVDNVNQKNEQNININYTDGVYFPITYRKVGDLYGLIAPDVITSYLVIENNNLKEFFKNIGVEDDEMPDKINFKTDILEFSEDEKEKIKDKYFEIIDKNLSKEQFTKSKSEKQKIFTLSLTEMQYKNLKINILTELKQDEIILSKLQDDNIKNKFIEYIDEILAKEQEKDATDKSINIIEYIENGKLVKTEIKSDENNTSINKIDNGFEINTTLSEDGEELQPVTITITKSKSGSNIEYDIYFYEVKNGERLNIQLIFSGLQSLYTVKETLNVELQSTESPGKFSYENEKQFTDSVEIEEFDEDNSFKINELNGNELSTLLQAVIQKVIEVNNDKMEQINQ